MIDKIKKISKYIMNFLAMANAVLVALAPTLGWDIDTISKVLVVVDGLIGTWLVGGKLFDTTSEYEETNGVG